MGQANVVELTERNFAAEVLSSEAPVLVDFWAPGCRPCQLVSEMIDRLAPELDGQVRIGKLDTDANPGVAEAYDVRLVPTLLLFVNGDIRERFVGTLAPVELLTALRAHV